MYIFRIETQNKEVVGLLKEIYFDNQYNGTSVEDFITDYVFELHFLTEKNAKVFQDVYKEKLKDYDDTDVFYFWQDDEETEVKGINYYDEYGLKESDFI